MRKEEREREGERRQEREDGRICNIIEEGSE